MVMCVLATLGPGAMLAALNVKYRDFRYVIPFLVQVLFFLTPVIYPPSILQNPLLEYILAMSPIYAAIELFRYPLTGGEGAETALMFMSLGSGLLLFLVGIVYFKRSEDFFADFA